MWSSLSCACTDSQDGDADADADAAAAALDSRRLRKHQHRTIRGRRSCRLQLCCGRLLAVSTIRRGGAILFSPQLRSGAPSPLDWSIIAFLD